MKKWRLMSYCVVPCERIVFNVGPTHQSRRPGNVCVPRPLKRRHSNVPPSSDVVWVELAERNLRRVIGRALPGERASIHICKERVVAYGLPPVPRNQLWRRGYLESNGSAWGSLGLEGELDERAKPPLFYPRTKKPFNAYSERRKPGSGMRNVLWMFLKNFAKPLQHSEWHLDSRKNERWQVHLKQYLIVSCISNKYCFALDGFISVVVRLGIFYFFFE